MKQLFERTQVGTLNLKNRLFKAAIWERSATEEGGLTEELLDIYKGLAQGGVGAIITSCAYICEDEKPNPRMMGIYADWLVEDYKRLTECVHQYDVPILMQIVYGGSQSALKEPSPNRMGPSAIANRVTGIIPQAMTKEEIDQLVEDYAQAARRIKEAGFDGVEIHAAHGYLLSQFLSPYYNRRTDAYGGSSEKRGRIVIEVYRAIRAAVGERFPILIKINTEDFMEEGLTSEESLLLCKQLAEEGIDAIELSGGMVLDFQQGPARIKRSQTVEDKAYFEAAGRKFAKALQVPIILTGGNRSFEESQKLLQESDIAYIGMGRPFICESDLANKWQENPYAQAKCVAYNRCFKIQGCRCAFNQ